MAGLYSHWHAAHSIPLHSAGCMGHSLCRGPKGAEYEASSICYNHSITQTKSFHPNLPPVQTRLPSIPCGATATALRCTQPGTLVSKRSLMVLAVVTLFCQDSGLVVTSVAVKDDAELSSETTD